MKTLATHNKPFITAKAKRAIVEGGAGVLCDKCKTEMVYTGVTVLCDPPEKTVTCPVCGYYGRKIVAANKRPAQVSEK